MFELNILQAGAGDALFIKYLNDKSTHKHILIDGGTGIIYKKSLKSLIDNLEKLDLVIITHIDLDHIGGINKLLDSKNSKKVKKVYFNSGNLINKTISNLVSISDGVKLTEYIKELNIEMNDEYIIDTSEFYEDGLSICFLSPTIEALKYLEKNWIGYEKEQAQISATVNIDNRCLSEIALDDFIEKNYESDIANWSSLAFEIEYKAFKILILGDAKDSVVVQSLKDKKYHSSYKYKVDYIKVSHHGSKYNTSNEFLSLLECYDFIFSTNGTHGHPDIETIARIICHPKRDYSKSINLYFNYPKDEYIMKQIRLPSADEEEQFNFQSIYDFKTITLGE